MDKEEKDNLKDRLCSKYFKKSEEVKELACEYLPFNKNMVSYINTNNNIFLCSFEFLKNKNTHPDALALLAKSKNSSIRVYSAMNPNTPQEIIDELLFDFSPKHDVSSAAAENPNVSVNKLSSFIDDYLIKPGLVNNFRLTLSVVNNPVTPKEYIIKIIDCIDKSYFAFDQRLDIKAVIALRDDIDSEIAQKLLDDNPEIATFLAFNENLPDEFLEKIKGYEDLDDYLE